MQPARPLAHPPTHRHPRAPYTHVRCLCAPQVALLKVYKEFSNSAWNLWRAEARDKGVRTVGDWVHGDPEPIKAALKGAQAKFKEVGGALGVAVGCARAWAMKEP